MFNMIKKGEIRAIVKPEIIISKLKELGVKRKKLYEGIDFYFDKKLFQKGYHLRVRDQTVIYPKKTKEYFLSLKIHEPNFRKMNVYKSFHINVLDGKLMGKLLNHLGYKEIFIEQWDRCEEFKINNLKVELFFLKGWDWLIEVESIIEVPKEKLYNRFLETIDLFDLKEKDLALTEPAEYIFKKKVKCRIH